MHINRGDRGGSAIRVAAESRCNRVSRQNERDKEGWPKLDIEIALVQLRPDSQLDILPLRTSWFSVSHATAMERIFQRATYR